MYLVADALWNRAPSDLCSELPAWGMISDLWEECRTLFREALQFTVMSVTVVTLPVSMGACVTVPMRNPRGRHSTVMVTVIERTA